MKKITHTVEYHDGTTVEVITSPADSISYETTAPARGWPTSMSDAPNLAGAYMAHHALRRLNKTDLVFDDWLETVAGLESSYGEVNPTR